jgi:hypothetical protein
VIITFSARSLPVSPSGLVAVPLIGADVRTPSSRRRNSSGDAVTTQVAGSPVPAGTWTPPAYGAGLPAASTAESARAEGSALSSLVCLAGRLAGSGADSTRQTFAW